MSVSGAEVGVEQRLARLEDERAIERLKYRYAGYCDNGYDAEGIVSVFVPDGRWVCTPASHGGEAVGHEAMREFFPQLEAAITWAAHYASAPSIEVAPDGQSAEASFYFLGLLTSGREPAVTPEAMVLSGTYRDRFVKVDGEWLFASLEANLTQAARWTEGWVREPWGRAELMGALEGKVAVVAAGGSGIGRASALQMAAAGATVAIVDLDGEAASAVAGEIEAAGGSATGHQADCANLAELDRFVAEVSERHDRVDVFLGNVGMPNPHGISDISEAQWQLTMDVNLKSNFFLTQKLLPLMRASGEGASIVFTASAAGLVASRTTPLYTLTKAGLIGLTKALAVHLADEGIRVNAVCPGPVRTPMLPGFMDKGVEATDEVAELYSSRVPLGRVAEAGEIAAAIVYLASDAASYVTGVPFPVDGGYVAQ